MYFSAYDDVSGKELWKYDGVSVSLVADINPGSSSSDPGALIAVGNTLYFRANDNTSGYELWKYDGTTTSLIEAIPGRAGGYPNNLTALGNLLFFSAHDGSGIERLWKYDGISINRVADINFGSSLGYRYFDLTSVGNDLYFSTFDNNTGDKQLWKYDGISTQASLLDISDRVSESAQNLTAVGNTLYFSANDGHSGYELWRFDGTSVNLVADIIPGNRSSHPNNFTALGNTLYFRADDGESGAELWQYDGISAGRVADINPGIDGSLRQFSDLTAVGNNLYFSANDGLTGQEPWVLLPETTVNPTPALAINAQLNGLDTTKPGPTLSAGSNLAWTYTANNAGNTVLHDVSIRVRQKLPVFGNWQTRCFFGTLEAGEVAGCEIQDVAVEGTYIALVVIRGTTSTGEVVESISKVFYQGETAVIDPRLLTKRNIALDVLEAKGFDQATHDTLLAEINAATSVSALHIIIVQMRADTNTSGGDSRLNVKRTIALNLLEAKGFDQIIHDGYLVEINAATGVGGLHAIILRMRSSG